MPPRAKRNGSNGEPPSDLFRTLPASPDTEQGVLASCLLAREAIGLCIERGVNDEWFHVPAHATIYEVITDLWNMGKPTDFIAVTEALRSYGFLDVVGGAGFVTSLFTLLPTAANAGYYLDILAEKRMLRQIIKNGTKYASSAYDEQQDATQLLDDYEKETMAIRRLTNSRKANVRDLIMEVIDDLQNAYENPGVITGLATGYRRFDSLTDGLQDGQMIVIAARPSHGKSAFALGIVEELCLNQKKPVAVFSLEMNAKEWAKRLLFSLARVNFFRFRDGHTTPRDFPALTASASKIAAMEDRLIIDDAAGQSIQEIRAKARRMKSENKIEAVFIDYLQLLKSNSKRAGDNRQVEVAECSTGCKEMARELSVPAVVLAQIDRAVEKNGGRKPRLSDLRESGAIEQDADTVCFLVREDLMAETDEERLEIKGKTTVHIAKQRAGPVCEIPMHFQGEYTRFTDVDNDPDSAQQMEFTA